jgi:hypothetical protein
VCTNQREWDQRDKKHTQGGLKKCIWDLAWKASEKKYFGGKEIDGRIL